MCVCLCVCVCVCVCVYVRTSVRLQAEPAHKICKHADRVYINSQKYGICIFFLVAGLLTEERTTSFLLTDATVSSLLRVAPSHVKSLYVCVSKYVCV
jgi:hypothetical protein